MGIAVGDGGAAAAEAEQFAARAFFELVVVAVALDLFGEDAVRVIAEDVADLGVKAAAGH